MRWPWINDKVLRIQTAIYDPLITAKTQNTLDKLLGDIHKRDIAADLSRLMGLIDDAVGRLEKRVEEGASSEISVLKHAREQRERIAGIVETMLKVNRDLLNGKE